MKVTELRTGNLINNDNRVMQINEMTSNGSVTCSGCSFSGMVHFDEHEIKPIQITEERMTKLGFKMVLSAGGYYFKMDEDYRFCIIDGIVHVSVGEDKLGVLLVKLQYVHELQNLYYALRKIEL